MDHTIHDLLRSREARALRLSIYGHMVILMLMGIIAAIVSQSAFEVRYTTMVCLVELGLLGAILIPVRKEKWLTGSGILIATLDALTVAVLPFLWYAAAGGDAVPRAYFVKSISLVGLSLVVMVANAVALRPLFIVVITVESCITHLGLLWYALSDPRSVVGNSWVDTMLGPIVNVGYYVSIVIQIAVTGALLAFIAARARKIIVGAIQMERLNGHIGRYFSPRVRQELTSAGSEFFKPGGKEQEIVVLFSDIRGFTALSERIGPAAVVALLSEYQKLMLDIIFKYGGTLDKFIGDAIFATFGTPEPAADDSDRALACAIEMMQTLDTWNASRRATGGIEIITGTGLHAGPAIVGNIGSEERLEYTVIGDTVNTASRVESATKKLQKRILLTGSVKERLNQAFPLVSVGNVMLRGKTKAIHLYEVA
ncbi:MAG: adenylate/guanylate cyclase domain-containing protein [Spirochaetia bacterium]|nr:adenylate/guanylate cyclase domain-containing protein [Spirochaetia bacterium]